MFHALDLYLSTASCTELVLCALLPAITIGLGPFTIANLIDHILVARRISQGAR